MDFLPHKYVKQEHLHRRRIRSVKFSVNISVLATAEYPTAVRRARKDFPFIKVARLRPLNNTSLSCFLKFAGPTNTTYEHAHT